MSERRILPRHTYSISGLLFCSGLCALIYQVAWLRELRLVFGASTPASAAVLAVFMGGLGAGGLWLGRRADRVERPLKMYARLEGGVAICAAVTPLLLVLTRGAYVALGGTTTLGMALGTVVRLLLSALVLLPPTLLMGGTLPAAARAGVSDADVGRRTTALLYGANTLGAVTGAAASTFVMLEVFGTRMTLWIGCLVNVLVAVGANALDRRLPAPAGAARDDRPRVASRADISVSMRRFVLLAAAAVGFAFLLMELVWYRMLAPLLGGSSYTFGLILAVALLGIGVGGLAYTLHGSNRPARMTTFATSCALEAVLLAIPYALGDRLALLAMALRDFGVLGFWGHVGAWTVVAAIVVLPASVVAGYQFPLLVALLGRAERQLGSHVGLAYAFNTLGAIGGSLAGGFWLMTTLSAPGSWRLVVIVLVGLAAGALLVDRGARGVRWASMVPAALAALAPLLLLSQGPTAVWRHSPIGAGRVDDVLLKVTRNGLEQWKRERRRAVVWEADGREAAVALHSLADTAFLVSGKSDGEAISDGPTQVMGGLLGALFHPEVKTAMVIGLGTGSTAGWLAAMPSVEHVDVVEIEPAIVQVARACHAVNHEVLDDPKVNLVVGDGREVLLTTTAQYDLIFSEPSNPYRAGIASLFTREFYEAIRQRLKPGGVFVQFVQAYEIDAVTVGTVYTTLSTVFGSVESWRAKPNDLLLLARADDQPIDAAAVRERISADPFRSALMAVWRVHSLEGVLAHHVARPSLARAVAAAHGAPHVNTDDRNLLEFAVARTVGRARGFSVDQLLEAAAGRGEARPDVRGEVDWERVEDEYVSTGTATSLRSRPFTPRRPSHGRQSRYLAQLAWSRNDLAAVRKHWGDQAEPPRNAVEMLVVADAAADAGADATDSLIEQLAAWQPTEALAVRARYRYGLDDLVGADEALRQAIMAYRSDPWPSRLVMENALHLAPSIARRDPSRLTPLFDLLAEPFAADSLRYLRERLRVELAMMAPGSDRCLAAFSAYEPHLDWDRDFLTKRVQCYARAGLAAKNAARADLQAFLDNEGQEFGSHLLAPRPTR